MEEFDYRIRWRTRGVRPGIHLGTMLGAGTEFHTHVGILDAGDPRRLDLRASIASPGRAWRFRLYRQAGEIQATLLADLSASMAYTGTASKPALLARLVRIVGRSAQRAGDRFSFLAADAHVRDDLFLPPTRAYGAVAELAERLQAYPPAGRGHAGLMDAAAQLAGRRKLVFVASDFHFPIADTVRLLQTLAEHQVVPLVLWDDTETEALPGGGFALLEDAESGSATPVWLRPSQRARWRAAVAARRVELERTFLAAGAVPLFVGTGFTPEMLADHFLEGR